MLEASGGYRRAAEVRESVCAVPCRELGRHDELEVTQRKSGLAISQKRHSCKIHCSKSTENFVTTGEGRQSDRVQSLSQTMGATAAEDDDKVSLTV